MPNVISTWYLELYIPVELGRLQRQGRCLILFWLGTRIWGLFLKADGEPLHLLFQFSWGRPPPILRRYKPWVLAGFKVHIECLLTVFLEVFIYVQGQHCPFSFLVALSASASWSWAWVYCGRVKVNSGIFQSTKVLIDPPHQQAQISQLHVLRLYLLVGFPMFVTPTMGSHCFGDSFLLVTPTMHHCHLFRFPYSI